MNDKHAYSFKKRTRHTTLTILDDGGCYPPASSDKRPNENPWDSGFYDAMTDPNGSYTGVPIDETDRPIQDADDL